MTDDANDQKLQWAGSRAKDILISIIMNDGDMTDDGEEMLPPSEVYELAKEFKDFKYATFRNNLRLLHKSLRTQNGNP
ncbi:hypothetical protein ACA910_010087 [Epithemia clementina (nom. ined.)]